MAKAGYEPILHEEHFEAQQAQQPRSWHGSLLNCCGLGLSSTGLGVSTALVTHYFPCVTFGTSMRRAFGRSAVRSALIVLTLVLLSYAHWATQSAFLANECLVEQPSPPHAHHHSAPRHIGPGFGMQYYEIKADGTLSKLAAHPALTSVRGRCAKPFGAALDAASESPLCQRLTNAGMVLNVATMMWFLLLVAYGATHRTAMRERFGIEGSRLGDCCSWFWCMHCALCQESRTLAINNVEGGAWLGRDYNELPVVSAADMATAPSAPVMATELSVDIMGAASVLPDAEKQAAAAKL